MKNILEKFTIRNSKGFSAIVSPFGAKLISLIVPDKNGFFRDVVIGFDQDEDYFLHDPYLNSVCGRFAGRIGKAKFNLNGQEYRLTQNAGEHQLHGGFQGFHNRFWKVESHPESSITLSYFSEDGEEGFPGNLKVWVTYEMDEQNQIITRFQAQTDQTTVVNLCQHPYFNLNGSGTIFDHQLQIDSDQYLLCDDQMIPTGVIKSVDQTILDFRNSKRVKEVIEDPILAVTQGLDHCFIIKNKGISCIERASVLYAPESGIRLEVFSNQKALVVYSGNFIEDHPGKNGTMNGKHTAICLESQGFPDSPNHKHFPSSVLEPGEEFESIICWRFSAE